jgi:HSP20 family protein
MLAGFTARHLRYINAPPCRMFDPAPRSRIDSRPWLQRRGPMADTPVEVKKATHRQLPEAWKSFRQEMDRWFDRFDSQFLGSSMRHLFDVEPLWRHAASFDFNLPAVDASEDDKGYKLTVELPGMDEKNVDVSVSGDTLVIKGEKHQEKEEKDKNYFLSERSYGSFQRSFRLPDSVDRENVAAAFAKGVLTVTLPKSADAQKQQKKIEIKAA